MRLETLVLPALLLFVTIAHSATYVVLNKSDSGAGSFRQTIINANAGSGGTIVFSNLSGTISLLSNLPALTANITISGPGSATLTISNVPDTTATLTNSAGNTAVLTGLTFQAGLDNYGTLTLRDVVIKDPLNPSHAGLYNSGTTTLSNCVFTTNRVSNGAADAIENDGTINLDHCSITNNTGGCAVYNRGNLIMDNSLIAGNRWFTSGDGGIVNDGGTVILRNCSISNNWAIEGGGILNGGFLAVTNCIINGNSAMYSEPGERGGGLFNTGYAILQNTTVSGNSTFGDGGGIWNQGGLRLLNCSIISNKVSQIIGAPATGGGVWNSTSDPPGTFQIMNSIIAGNFHTTNQTVVPDDIHGYVDSFGHNLILSNNGWTKLGGNNTDLIGVNPLLGPLQDNGGPTWTHALLQGSPAINAGDPNGAPIQDQRGVPRQQGPGVDIGAFELVYFMNSVFASITPQSSTNVILKASGSPFTSYILQGSPNFVSWTNVDTVTSQSNGVLQISEPLFYPRLFFRLKLQTP